MKVACCALLCVCVCVFITVQFQRRCGLIFTSGNGLWMNENGDYDAVYSTDRFVCFCVVQFCVFVFVCDVCVCVCVFLVIRIFIKQITGVCV